MAEDEKGPSRLERSRAGTTANIVFVTKTHIYCANAGDSRAIAVKKNG